MNEISEEEYQELYSNFSLHEMEIFLDRVLNITREEKVSAGAAGWRVAREMLTEKALSNLMTENREKIHSITQEVTSSVLLLPGGTHSFDVARDALNNAVDGKILPKALETIYMDTKDMVKLLEVSRLVRENFYIYYKYVDNYTLGIERSNLIKIYNELRAKALDNLEEIDHNKDWGYNVELSFRGEVNSLRDSITVERKTGAGFPDEQPNSLNEKSYPPTSYDDNYYLFKKILDPKRYEIPNREKFQDALYFLDKHIAYLSNYSDMDTADYRRYRLQCAGFTDEEVKTFDEDIKECLDANKEKHR